MGKRHSSGWRLTGLLVLCCLLTLGGCQKKQEGKVISKKHLAEVLTDVYLTDAMLNQMDHGTRNRWSRGLSREYFQDVAYRHILEKHHVSEEDFYASVAYYSRRNKVMSKICTQVIKNLNAVQAEVDRREELERLAEERRRFELKWRTVDIRERDVAPWADWLLVPLPLENRDTALYLSADSGHIAAYSTEDPYWSGVRQALEKVREITELDIFQVDSAYLQRRTAQHQTEAVEQAPAGKRLQRHPAFSAEEFRTDDGGGH